MTKFKGLKVGEHFKFITMPNGMFYPTYLLVGEKRGNKEYRMGGLNRIVDHVNVIVTPTTEPLN